MKILVIRVKNLASLEGLTEIDFTKEPLKSAGIFAITGPMGAGKSTLLDALCLALFSKTPRHLNAKESGIELQDVANSTIGQGDPRGILRKGCGEGFAEVEFVGVDDNKHKATWSVKRARNKINGALQPDTVELTNLSANVRYPQRKMETLKEIERLIGLNFEQFTRSVLLAQGEFTAFLKADKDQKSSLLEKLTGTDIYSEISKLIYEKYKQAEQEFSHLQRQLEGITLLPAADLQLFNEQKSTLINNIIELEKENLSLIAELGWHQTLNELTVGVQQAEAELIVSKKEKEDASERIKTFTLVEAVQDAKFIFDTKTEITDQSGQKSKEHQALQLTIQELNVNHGLVLKQLTDAESVLLKNEKESVDARPLIDKSKELDTIIKEKKEQVKLAGIESVDATNNKEKHTVLIKSKATELESIFKQVAELTTWRQENELRKPIAENLQLIISKLGDAGKLLTQEKRWLADLEAGTENLNKALATIETLGKKFGPQEIKLAELNAMHLIKNAELSAITIDDIKANEKILTASIEEIIPAKGCWELLYSHQQEFDNIMTKLEHSKNEIIIQQENLTEQNNRLQEASIKKEHAEKILSRAELQIAENVEDMRAQLVDGEPCPVCGSIHHPFTATNLPLHQLLEGLKNEQKECTDSYNQLLKNCASLEKLCENLEHDGKDFEKAAGIKSIKINEFTQKWQTYKINETCLSLPADERLAWLDNKEIILKRNLKEIQSQSSAYNLLKADLELLRTDIYNGQKDLDAINNNLKDTQREKQTFDTEIKRLGEQLVRCKADTAVITQDLDPYFPSPDWCQKWQQDPASFVGKIKNFTNEWNEKNQSLTVGTTKLELLATELNGLQQQMEGLELAVTVSRSKLTGLQDLLSTVQAQRKLIFNGEEIGLIEQKMIRQIEASQKILKDCKFNKETLDAALIKGNSNLDQFILDISAYNKKITELNRQIQEWIENYNSKNKSNLSENDVRTLLAYTTAWIIAERKSLTQIEDSITRSKATFEERALQLFTHSKKKPSGRSPENLRERQLEVNVLTDSCTGEKNEIEFKLRQDAANKKLSGNLVEAIKLKNGIYENWQKLNELLGSADGKKFRQIAQEYTLDILLGFTNIHLQDLANRYKLSRVPNTLALQVLDRDMGDEIRSVHSLSGGESFLVSLALALGLASLSSNRMKVESLFIDEGFGSLDQATLSIAMDALERLHNQGRKVGVISHVQEMTERIQAQIKISRISNGRSKVEVSGFLV